MTPALGLATIDLDDAAIAALQSARYVYTAIGDLRCLRHQDQTAATVMQDHPNRRRPHRAGSRRGECATR